MSTLSGYAAVAATLPAGVRLIAVSKGRDRDAIESLHKQGAVDFGENRVQEAEQKFADPTFVPGRMLHLIGPLQSNKVTAALRLFDYIHSLDRESLAEALVRRREAGAKLPQLLMQVNLGREPQKSGVAPEQAEALATRLRQVHNLPLIGLMTVPPAGIDPTPYFQELATMARQWGLPQLSMGMSDDWPEAVKSGSTMLRIGRALF